MVLDMHSRDMSPCEKLPGILRALFPAAMLCALAGLLLPGFARAQSDRPARPSPAPASSAVAASTQAALSEPGPGAVALGRIAGARLSPKDLGQTLLSRALDGTSDGTASGPDLSSLRDFLPPGLYHDVLELRDRVVRARSRVFGRRGIVSLGQAGEVGRLRLNLQHSPDPGIRFTLVTH